MLNGNKVVLREKRTSDAVNDYAWRCDAELARLDAAAPLKLSFSDFMSLHADEFQHPVRQRCRFAIETLDGKHIGNCMYYDIDEKKGQAELGIMIGDRSYWDRGYGTDAIAILVRHIFEETKLERIYLNTLDWNIRAQRCFEKCGFVACGTATRGRNNFITMELRRGWFEEGSVAQGKLRRADKPASGAASWPKPNLLAST